MFRIGTRNFCDSKRKRGEANVLKKMLTLEFFKSVENEARYAGLLISLKILRIKDV